ncbi:MAG: prephenate dehydrogenase/arogenate dehydrogenase family protein [Candidatus Helarchaeota archaeon]
MKNSIKNFFKQKKIAIIGGTGGMGKVFIKNLKDFTKIMICSRNIEKAQRVASDFGNNIESGLINDCNNADIVIVSVPTENMLDTCRKVIKIMKDGSLLMDQSSVKTGLVDKLEIPNSIEYISTHCLFGPLGDFSGENVILIPVKGNFWLPKIKRLFEELGSNVFIKSLEEHDFIMGKIQALFHFIILNMVVAMSKSDINPNFYTRSFKMMIPNLKNLQNNLNVIFEIQKINPYAKKMREFFVQIVNEINNLNLDEFEKLVRKSFDKLEI